MCNCLVVYRLKGKTVSFSAKQIVSVSSQVKFMLDAEKLLRKCRSLCLEIQK